MGDTTQQDTPALLHALMPWKKGGEDACLFIDDKHFPKDPALLDNLKRGLSSGFNLCAADLKRQGISISTTSDIDTRIEMLANQGYESTIEELEHGKQLIMNSPGSSASN